MNEESDENGAVRRLVGHDREAEQIRRLTDDPRLPEGACRSGTALYAGPYGLVIDLAERIRLENEVLYPMFEVGCQPAR